MKSKKILMAIALGFTAIFTSSNLNSGVSAKVNFEDQLRDISILKGETGSELSSDVVFGSLCNEKGSDYYNKWCLEINLDCDASKVKGNSLLSNYDKIIASFVDENGREIISKKLNKELKSVETRVGEKNVVSYPAFSFDIKNEEIPFDEKQRTLLFKDEDNNKIIGHIKLTFPELKKVRVDCSTVVDANGQGGTDRLVPPESKKVHVGCPTIVDANGQGGTDRLVYDYDEKETTTPGIYSVHIPLGSVLGSHVQSIENGKVMCKIFKSNDDSVSVVEKVMEVKELLENKKFACFEFPADKITDKETYDFKIFDDGNNLIGTFKNVKLT